jgi:protein tyrosine/serine phosphatase
MGAESRVAIAKAAWAFMTHATVPLENSYWVIAGKFLAGEHPVEVSDDLTQARLNALLDAGVRTFVNLTEAREKMQDYSQLLRSLATDRRIEVQVLQMSIPDRRVPSTEVLKSILNAIDDSLANENPVFVHCFAGVGRTGTIVGCYLQRHGRTTAEGVMKTIAELRKQMPGGNEVSPHMPEQVQLVTGWRESW